MVQVTHLLRAFILILFGYSSGLGLHSEESTLPRQLSAVVPYGKRLKISVKNVQYSALLWRLNGTSISEKCEAMMVPGGSTLICPDMDWSDAGLYECQGFTKGGQKEILLAVDVNVAECTEKLAVKQQVELLESSSQESEHCFCSGITDQCWMADNLFRTKITANVSEGDIVDLKITDSKVEESWNEDDESDLSTYYSLPIQMKGNLLKSYGGYLDFPSNDDGFDEQGPDVVLLGKHQTLVYYNSQVISGEISRNRVQMTEQSWRQLNSRAVSKYTFMTVLSSVKEFYVKYNQYRRLEPMQIVLDSADIKDHGLGKVATVEECVCRTGYKGLSCESCLRGFYRRYAVREQGICVSLHEKWESLKASIGRQHRWERIRNNIV